MWKARGSLGHPGSIQATMAQKTVARYDRRLGSSGRLRMFPAISHIATKRLGPRWFFTSRKAAAWRIITMRIKIDRNMECAWARVIRSTLRYRRIIATGWIMSFHGIYICWSGSFWMTHLKVWQLQITRIMTYIMPDMGFAQTRKVLKLRKISCNWNRKL